MRLISLVLLLLVGFNTFARPRIMASIGGLYGFYNQGYVQVREWELEGDRLDLDDDLGIDAFYGLGFGLGLEVSQGHWIDLNHSEYRFEGNARFNQTFNFNGGVFAAGPTDVSKTRYRRTSLTYSYVIDGDRNSSSLYSVGGGLLLETLTFDIDGEFDPSSTRFEKYEGFSRQLVPVPMFEANWRQPWLDEYAYGFYGAAAWLPKTKTWYKEGGSIYFEQYNIDLKAEVLKFFKSSNVALGYYFKIFHQHQSSREDTNDFQLVNSNIYLEYRYFF